MELRRSRGPSARVSAAGSGIRPASVPSGRASKSSSAVLAVPAARSRRSSSGAGVVVGSSGGVDRLVLDRERERLPELQRSGSAPSSVAAAVLAPAAPAAPASMPAAPVWFTPQWMKELKVEHRHGVFKNYVRPPAYSHQFIFT
eukprot:TRINITY_DN47490_c0_g1_i1.p3 TRINITY_DN47490_c0_g1~~TRINITY_DN47490_c0_g1_i1.p3  ORF type:complete len:144 (-),score=31.35 TRINITY_DN47490_c0_g1_i1:78-509(-)